MMGRRPIAAVPITDRQVDLTGQNTARMSDRQVLTTVLYAALRRLPVHPVFAAFTEMVLPGAMRNR